jgi:LPXTG-site transpeptidase (sortase) family protein
MRKDKIKYVILRTLGNFFLLFSIYGMVMTFGPVIYYETAYRFNILRNVTYVVDFKPEKVQVVVPNAKITPSPTSTVNRTFFGQIVGGNKVEVLSPISSQFGIVIPKIGANAAIIPNVDSGNQVEYLAALKAGVAHAKGTVFPGVPGNIYLFAHSTDAFWNVGRYNAVFYLLNKLENGDEIDIFYQGIRHKYRVINILTVDPSQTRYLTQLLSYEQLTLQTCWPPGTTLKRMLVMAIPEKDLIK